MTTKACFPTLIYFERVKELLSSEKKLLKQLTKESYAFADLDRAGVEWSRENFPGGYTSYSSLSKLWQQSPTFAALKKILDRHAQRFARELDFDLRGKKLEMVSCWINIVPPGTYHGLHLHPLSTLSGTVYLQTPPKSGKLKIEDPRLSKMMAAPSRRESAHFRNQQHLWFRPAPGKVLLFESWLRHEVEQNLSSRDRISISFNYNWF